MGRGVVIRIARRYFRGRGFLSFIQTMAVGGVAVGSAGLLIALSVVHGFRSVIEQKTLQFAPHVTVTAPFSEQIHRADTLTAWLVDVDGVAAASAMVLAEVMVQHGGRITGGVMQEFRAREPRWIFRTSSALGVGTLALMARAGETAATVRSAGSQPTEVRSGACPDWW